MNTCKFNVTFMNLQFTAYLGGCCRYMYFYEQKNENRDFALVNENEDDSATKLDMRVP